jgi:SEL1 protein
MKIGILALLVPMVISLATEGLMPEQTKSQINAQPSEYDISTQESLLMLKKTTSNPSYMTYTSDQEFIPTDSHEHPKTMAFSTILNNANKGHLESIRLAADILLFGMYEIQPNNVKAFDCYQKLSDLSDSYGQYMIGQLYATGMGVERNYQKALIYTTFAASKDNLMAHHTLGYWFHSGIGVSQNCQKALFHYQKIAESNYKTFVNGKPGGTTLPPVHKSLGKGLYGKGASGTGNPLLSLAKEPVVQEADLLLLYKLQAEAGDAGSQFMLGQYYYAGTNTLEADFQKAHLYFQLAAKQYPSKPTKDQTTQETVVNRNTAKAASESAGYLGKMYWRGEGVKEDHEIARKWFERGASQDNPASTTYLAKMYLEGVGGLEKSKEKYEYYLNLASTLGHAYGKVLLGELLMEKGILNLTRNERLGQDSSIDGRCIQKRIHTW